MTVFGEHRTNSASETEALGERLAEEFDSCPVAAFVGDLGSGKTTMIRGVARALGADSIEVASPTFTIVNRYSCEPPVYHIDLFRIKKPSEIDELGLWEIVDGEGVSLIEWADLFPKLVPESAIWVSMSREGPDIRRIIIGKRPDFKKDENGRL